MVNLELMPVKINTRLGVYTGGQFYKEKTYKGIMELFRTLLNDINRFGP